MDTTPQSVIEISISELASELSHYLNVAYYVNTTIIVTSHGNPKVVIRGFSEQDQPIRAEMLEARQ